MAITKTINLLPSVFRSETNQKFLNATLDQLVTEANLKVINGYVGRKFAPGSTSDSTYITEPTSDRRNYQLEPSLVVKNTTTGEVDFHVTYPEVMQKIGFYGGATDKPSRMWSNEYYSYDPKINLDAFINFGQYYWVTDQPTVNLSNVNASITSTTFVGEKNYTVVSETAAANVDLTNGLKVTINSVDYYVEGVGTAIKLVTASDLGTATEALDYLVINRASRDLNPWTRNNRWVHRSVLEATATYNGTTAAFNQANRANRPIIEFVADLQLFNYGTRGIAPVTLVDFTQTQPLVYVEGQTSATLGTHTLVDGDTVIFANDEDVTTRGTAWQVNFEVEAFGQPARIHLTPLAVAVAGTTAPISSSTTAYWFDGTAWQLCQAKAGVNQAPKFDVFDSTGRSYSDTNKYPSNNPTTAFAGSRVFGYKVGTGANDTVLGFPLSHKNFNSVGDILFENSFDVESFIYYIDNIAYPTAVNTGYLHKITDTGVTPVTVWATVVEDSKQMQALSYVYDSVARPTRSFTVDALPKAVDKMPTRLVYVNYNILSADNYTTVTVDSNTEVISINAGVLADGDRVDILVDSNQVSSIGYSEIPVNLNLNAQNAKLTYPTLGELRNHISKLTQHSLGFVGQCPGLSNLRDLDVVAQGGTMLQQSAPATYAFMFLSDDKLNFVDSVRTASAEYERFKQKFITTATNLHSISVLAQTDVVAAVDATLKNINAVKDTTFPWYYSDMVPYGDNANRIEYTVFDESRKTYELTSIQDNTSVNSRAVLIYCTHTDPLSGVETKTQLLYGKDYTFLTTIAGFELTSTAQVFADDVLTVVEYDTTDGCWIPETPTKLGLYPKFTPETYQDFTYRSKTSTTADVITRSMLRGHDGSLMPMVGTYANPDYRDLMLVELERRIYNNIKTTYNIDVLSEFDYKPGKFRNTGFTLSEINAVEARSYLTWAGYNGVDYTSNASFNVNDAFTYNYSQTLDADGEALPGSWRACYDYYYDCLTPNTSPWEMLGFTEQPDWWVDMYGVAPYTAGNSILWDDLEAGYIAGGARKGIDAHFARPGLSAVIPVDDSGNLLSPLQVLAVNYQDTTFSTSWQVGQWSPTETAWRNSSDHTFSTQVTAAISTPAKYFALGIATNLYSYNSNLAQFTLGDTSARLTQSDVVVHGAIAADGTVSRGAGYLNWISDYQTHLGVADKTTLQHYLTDYTVQLSYRMAGYSGKQLLKVLAEQHSPSSISDSIVIPDSDYDLVLHKSTALANPRYSAVILEKSNTGFKISGYDLNNPFFTVIPPSLSGRGTPVKQLDTSLVYPNEFLDFKITVPYGTELTSAQQVCNFLAGYERYLIAQGFRFDYFDDVLGNVRDWQLSANEMLFWTLQGWPVNSIIVLGPTADQIKFVSPIATVDKITNSFYGSKVMTQNFSVLDSDLYSVLRDNNTFSVRANSGNDMLSFVSFNLVQYEHVVVFNNKTQFNDTIYDPALGQRQYRLKLVGSKTAGWSGTVSAQGFIYNKPGVDDWVANTDYLRGDLVANKGFYYAASKDIAGAEYFDVTNWLPVDKNKIKTGLLNSFARNAGLGANFYETDGVNLESQYDLFGLGLIGYRNRTYLNDLGLDDTTQVKFYQGYIKQKGSQNAMLALNSVALQNQQGNLSYTEEWAFRLGSYGGLDTNKYVEFVMDENYIRSNPTSLRAVNSQAVEYSSEFTNTTGIYATSDTTWQHNFLLTRTDNSDYSEDILTAGFVGIDDVAHTMFDLSDASTLSANVADIAVSDAIWVAKDYTQNWNVYRVYEQSATVLTITNGLNGKLVFTTEDVHGLTVNDTVIVKDLGDFAGLYKVLETATSNSFVVAYSGDLTGFSNDVGIGPVHKLKSLRYSTASELAGDHPTDGWPEHSKVWVNNGTLTGQWAVYEKTNPWAKTSTLPRSALASATHFGSAVVLSDDTSFAAVGDPTAQSNVGVVVTYSSADNSYARALTVSPMAANINGFGSSLAYTGTNLIVGAPTSTAGRGAVYIYANDNTGKMVRSQILQINAASSFGTSIAASSDNQYLYVGAPSSNKVYVYTATYAAPHTIGILGDASTTSFTLPFTPAAAELLKVYSITKEYIPYVDYTTTSTAIVFHTAPTSGAITVEQGSGYAYATTLSGSNGFGYSVACDSLGGNLAVGSPTGDGAVTVYSRNTSNVFSVVNTVTGTASQGLGTSVDITLDGADVYAGAPLTSVDGTANVGQVVRLRLSSGSYSVVDTVSNPRVRANDKFGQVTKINSAGTILMTSSPVAEHLEETTFDSGATTLDIGSKQTTFLADPTRAGAVWVFGYLADTATNSLGKFAFIQQLGLDDPASSTINFGSAISLVQNKVLIGASAAPGTPATGQVYGFNNLTNAIGWDVKTAQEPKVDLGSIIKAYTYDASTQQLLDHLDYIDPAKGKILGLAEQDITYKTDYDPAIYNNGDDNKISINSQFHWNNTQVGQVWWDLSTLRYMDYEQSTIQYRTNNWGRLFPGSSIDVYEWVESLYPPSRYVASGGQGTPKAADNTAYVTISSIDPATGVTVVKYYFWVKDKPNVNEEDVSRTIPITTIAEYISNPKGTGIKFFAAIRNDAVALFNIDGELHGQDVILHLDYSSDLSPKPMHSEYALLSESNTRTVNIPPALFAKLVDSVVGQDASPTKSAVPDPALPVQSRYGIAIRPRQSMFIDNVSAGKELVEYVNSVLIKNVISSELTYWDDKPDLVIGNYDLALMRSADPVPSSNLYDLSVASYAELGYLDTEFLATGYKVLVEADSTVSNLWTLYELQADKVWQIVNVQMYRTSDFWTQVDWYAPGYDASIRPSYTINTYADINTVVADPGTIIKVRNNGRGRWNLLTVTDTYTYSVVGIESGTIALKSGLYDLPSGNMGFDADLFDSTARYDQTPATEFRNIITALKDDIFVGALEPKMTELFFAMMYYVLNEQKFVDWMFKTSFINVDHKLRRLEQPSNYSQENQTYYQSYINEVKPYRTTIREYVVSYDAVDNFVGNVTDFDSPTYFDTLTSSWRSPEVIFTAANTANAATYSYSVPYSPDYDAVRGNVYAPWFGNPASNNVRRFTSTIKYDRVSYTSSANVWLPETSYTAGDQLQYSDVVYTVTSDFTTPAVFTSNNLQAVGNVSANDRILAYYAPKAGMPGNDFALLQDNITFPGTSVTGLTYGAAGGFDFNTFDSDRFSQGLSESEMLDATLNPDLDLVKYPTNYYGISPDEFITNVVGGSYVDTFHSHAPEELVPGRVYDTLAMTVTTVSANAATFDANTFISSDYDTTPYGTFSYRVFKDMNDTYSYYKVADSISTTLAQDLLPTDTTIVVTSAAHLPLPNKTFAIPGSIFIDGERITYWNKVGNVLSNIRRGTAGTGATIHSAGDTVVASGQGELIPSTAHTTWTPSVDTTLETTVVGSYYTFSSNSTYIRGQLWLDSALEPELLTADVLVLDAILADEAGLALLTEQEGANVDVTVVETLTTEDGLELFTEPVQQPASGDGLYASTSAQAVFIKQA